jgi:hypothetical protein
VRPDESIETPLHKGIGIANVLHMEILLNSTIVDPRTCFIGGLHLSFSKIRLVEVSLELVRTETVNQSHEDVIAHFEVLDGSTVKGVIIPLRFHIGHLNCWPAPKDPKVVVEYAIRVSGLDEQDGKYVKLLPVTFAFRKPAAPSK